MRNGLSYTYGPIRLALKIMLTSTTVASSRSLMEQLDLPCTLLFSIVKGTVRVAHSVNRDHLDPHAQGCHAPTSHCCTVLACLLGGWHTAILGCLAEPDDTR
jgi:hypothetical protein